MIRLKPSGECLILVFTILLKSSDGTPLPQALSNIFRMIFEKYCFVNIVNIIKHWVNFLQYEIRFYLYWLTKSPVNVQKPYLFHLVRHVNFL